MLSKKEGNELNASFARKYIEQAKRKESESLSANNNINQKKANEMLVEFV